MTAAEILQFWGKTSDDLSPAVAHPIVYHALDAGAVAGALLDKRPLALQKFSDLLGLEPKSAQQLLVALVALHDLGKFAPAFQAKASEFWPTLLGDFPGPPPPRYHTEDGWVLWNGVLLDRLQPLLWPEGRHALQVLGSAVFGHHGRPVPPCNHTPANRFGAALTAVIECAELLIRLIVSEPIARPQPHRKAVRIASWWVAGLVTAADWVASGNKLFKHEWFAAARLISIENGFGEYFDAVTPRAVEAVRSAGLVQPSPSGPKSFASLMRPIAQSSSGREWEATAMQAWAETVAIPEGPTLFILEDVTGSGKTEAAHMLVHRLMTAGRAMGAYWAMPTQATANAMYDRQSVAISELYSTAGDARPSLVLAHRQQRLHSGFRSRVMENDGVDGDAGVDRRQTDELPGAAACAAFLADDSRAGFLADFGAGTIDQAILGVLPSKFNTMRLFGLCEKVLVVDEAHAYDAYVLRELDQLLRFQAALGGSAVILSATLNSAGRRKLAAAWLEGLRHRSGAKVEDREDSRSDLGEVQAYPVATVVSSGGESTYPQPAAAWASRSIPVRLVHDLDEVVKYIVEAQGSGAATVWIRNTVKDCIEAAELLRRRGIDPIVFHARFAQCDRQRIEQYVLSLFGKKARKSDRRGKVLIATQVVEQSLDLDFDVLVSDIAPIDLIIQRIGRYRRHADRDRSGLDGLEAEILVYAPVPDDNPPLDWMAGFKGTGFVYSHPGIIWRTIRELDSRGQIRVPDDVRVLVDAVYDRDDTPPAFEASVSRSEGKERASHALAGYGVLQVETGYEHDGRRWSSDLHMPTRLGMAVTTLRLARVAGAGELVAWDLEVEDRKRAWALSEVRVYSYMVPPGSQPRIEFSSAASRAKEYWGRFEKDLPLLPLVETSNGEFAGSMVAPDGKDINVRYSASTGLTIDKN